ncbi:MAG: strawberry notch C-terminal domain-containing protein, partial [Candidatus Competibacter sp.]
IPDTSDAMPSIEDELDAGVVYQERYTARSDVGEASTMIPANMASAVSRALDRVEARQGCDVDTFVGRELGMSAADRAAHFAPEQIDALALAFDAHDRGRGFIEADETGIGKGRVLAGVCLRAWRQGRPVIFLTEKPNLFSDFYRDLSHIGVQRDIVPLIVNEDTPIKDTERGTVLRPARRAADLRRAMTAETWPPGVNLVLATYSQLCQRGSLKTDWLCRIAEASGAQLIVDESHNASGDSNTSVNVKRLLEASGQPPIFSSATYAKRPDNLSVYASVLPELFRHDDIGLLLRQGGAPLQEAFSQMLAEDGVLIRREHDLSHITFRTEPDTARVDHHRERADRLASILEKMAWLGGDIEAFISQENQRLNERFEDNGTNKERKGHRAGLQTMNFGSRLYQLNRLFMLALKVDHAIEFGAREIEAGRKPVFVVENTLETLLKEIVTQRFDETLTAADADDEGATDEKAVARAADHPFAGLTMPAMTFRDALQRVLDRMLDYTERDGYGNTARRRISDPQLLDLAHGIEQDIAAFPDLSLSPLDDVRLALQARGYRIGELSGRSFQVEWVTQEDTRALRVRPRLAENRVDTVYRFNTDVYQGLIVTRSGSTGLSAHARDDVPGWSPAPRSMFELQIPQNVAERIQFWGRINRRGQCAAPTVVTPSTELPGEMRLIAMQNAKLRQLSANTTSNQDNAALAKNVPDVLNPLGNQIARRWVTQNPFQAARLSAEISEDRDGTPEWYINRITSRIMLLPVAEQETVLEELSGLYRARFDELKSQGIHPLRTAEFDWQAREVARDRFEQTPAGMGEIDSPFHAPIDFLTVDYEEARRPLRAAA